MVDFGFVRQMAELYRYSRASLFSVDPLDHGLKNGMSLKSVVGDVDYRAHEGGLEMAPRGGVPNPETISTLAP